jgi:protocatechuate 3,4-dioxygenase beta subunit
MNGSKAVGAVTADAFGHFSFSNIGPGSYTILATGIDATHIHYVGTANFTVSGATTPPVTVQVFPG